MLSRSSSGGRSTGRKSSSRKSRPTTSLSSSRRNEGIESCFVMAIVEGRGVQSEVGFAAMDIRTSECILCQFADSQSYVKTLHKLYLLNPVEIIFPNTTIEHNNSKLVKLIEENFPEIDIIPFNRKYFNETQGLNFIKNYGITPNSSILQNLKNKFFSVTCTAALINYFEIVESLNFSNFTIKFKYQTIDGLMMIDSLTAKNLELVSNISDYKGPTLFSTLNHCMTPMGPRLLRMNILQPLNDEATIEARLDAVTELLKEENFYDVKNNIKSFKDIDFIISSKHTIKLIEPLRTCLSHSDSILLKSIHNVLSDKRISFIEERIDEVINEDVTYQKTSLGLRNQRCYAVQAGFNGLLDVARQTYKETTNDVYDLHSSLVDKYDLPLLKVAYNPTAGFHLSLPVSCVTEEMPAEFINVNKKSKQYNFTTLKILSLNDRIQESLNEVYLMSDKIISELILEIRKNIQILYKVSESISLLDLLMSFSIYCTQISECVRPEFTDTLVLKKSVHPIRDFLGQEMISNDVYASEAENFLLVTGPNMSGKSTFLRQIALITILSQIGCYVPCEYASVRLADSVFSRIGNDDALEANASTFMVEMREMAFILDNVNNKSLVIIELGRGTSNADGIGITLAICEELIKKKAFFFFATHFSELTTAMSIYPNCINLHLEVDIVGGNNKAFNFLYKVKSGESQEKHYGLKLASLAGFPKSLISRANTISNFFENRNEELKKSNQRSKKEKLLSLKIKLIERLVQVKKSSNLNEDDLNDYLKLVQQDYFNDLQVINNEKELC
ncbi:MutS protein msh4 [Clydaea vesicula]|uniref:DNA mismatch repair protein MSH3 n=1 Tax=Clydaea vesicula TaxID=447962 RepID=A0AAD5XX98_9FUNG|nr:MutS protein msh4 [Clydaea vesicula]